MHRQPFTVTTDDSFTPRLYASIPLIPEPHILLFLSNKHTHAIMWLLCSFCHCHSFYKVFCLSVSPSGYTKGLSVNSTFTIPFMFLNVEVSSFIPPIVPQAVQLLLTNLIISPCWTLCSEESNNSDDSDRKKQGQSEWLWSKNDNECHQKFSSPNRGGTLNLPFMYILKALY